MTRLKTQEQLEAEKQAQRRASEVFIHTGKPAVVYARQSAKDQPVKNKEAKAMQTDDLLDLAEERGFVRAETWLFVENYFNQFGEYDVTGKPRNASGRLRIDQRAGLRHVLHLVESDQVSAVVCREVSRLFRQESMVGPAIFADACKQHNVVVITPSHIFDFNATQRDDLNRFLDEARIAAAYLKTLSEVAHKAKHRKGARGLYSGHAVPTGFMLDDDREHYIVNECWAPVVHDITRRFRELDGDFPALRREIFGKCLFPDLPPEIEARVGTIYLARVAGGYTIKSRGGLIGLLINPCNVGHMHFDGQIVKRNSHEAIVELDDYLFALYHLADTDLDGHPIERPERTIRIPQKATVPREGLLSGVRSNGRPVLASDQGQVYLFQVADANIGATYAIKDSSAHTIGGYIGSISVDMLDAVFEKRLLERLDELSHLVQSKQWRQGQAPVDAYETEELAQVAADLDQWHAERDANAEAVLDHFHQIRQEIIRSLAGVDKSIAESKRQIASLRHDIEADRANPFMDAIDREDCYSALKNLRANLAALERKKADADATTRAIEENGRKMVTARSHWPDMSLEKKKMFIRLVTQSIMLHDTGCGFFEMVVSWHPLMGHPQRERAFIMSQNGSAANWTPKEVATLTEYYPRGERSEIIHLLPSRSWRSIITKAHTLGIERRVRSSQSTVDVPMNLSLDIFWYMGEHGLGEARLGQAWWHSVSNIMHDGEG